MMSKESCSKKKMKKKVWGEKEVQLWQWSIESVELKAEQLQQEELMGRLKKEKASISNISNNSELKQ